MGLIEARADVALRREAPERRPAAVVGVIGGVATFAIYLVGWGRALSSDSSRTVGQFVTAPTLRGVLRQDHFNNHPLFSLLEHGLYVATRSTDERVLRQLPILFGALAVGLVGWAVAVRFGAIAGHVSAAILATNPLALRQFREVRGYSLVTLAAVVATLLLVRRLHSPHPNGSVAYSLSLAVAIGTHLFALGVLAVHVIVVVASARAQVRRWLAAWVAAITAGLAVQWTGIAQGIGAPPPRAFDPLFPARLAGDLLGAFAAPALLALVVIGWRALTGPRPLAHWSALGVMAIVGFCWVAAPSGLDARYFIWLAPAVAVLAGSAVAARPALVGLAVVGVALQVVVAGSGWLESDVPNRLAADFARQAQTTGESVCALGPTGASLWAYDPAVPAVWTASSLASCAVALQSAGPDPQPLLAPACHRFAYVLALPARHPGAVFTDDPAPLISVDAESGKPIARWTRTADAELCEPRS